MNGGGERKFLQVRILTRAVNATSGSQCPEASLTALIVTQPSRCKITNVTCHQDGDSVVMTGLCRGEGYNVGFGSVEGVVLPALQ